MTSSDGSNQIDVESDVKPKPKVKTSDPVDKNDDESDEEKNKETMYALIGTSSFHGVIQAYQQKNTFNRICWAVCILVCSSGFSVHLWSLVDRFVSLPTTIDMISSVSYDPFPAVSICPRKALSKMKWSRENSVPYEALDNQTLYKVFVSTLQKWKNLYSMLGEDPDDPRIVGRYWDKTEASIYRYQNLIGKPLGRRAHEMIFYCEVNNKPCSWKNFVEFDHYLYKRCFEFVSPYKNEVSDRMILGLYVEDDFTRSTKDIETIISPPGAYITLSEQKIFSNTDNTFEFLPVDTHTEIRVRQEGMIKVNKQRAPCFEDKFLLRPVLNNLEYNGSFKQMRYYKHNLIFCRQYYQQLECIKRCGCINSDLPPFADAIGGDTSLRFCDYIAPNENETILIKNFNCISQIQQDEQLADLQSRKCYSLCDQVDYKTTSYNMPWFGYTLNSEKQFLGEKVGKHLKNISNLENGIGTLSNPSIFGLESCLNRSLVRPSLKFCFLLVTINFETPRKEIIREYEAYLLRNFFSDLGGIMGLWIGVSLVTVIEIIHAVVNISKQNAAHKAASIKRKSMRDFKMKKSMSKKKIPDEKGMSSSSAPGEVNPTYCAD